MVNGGIPFSKRNVKKYLEVKRKKDVRIRVSAVRNGERKKAESSRDTL